MVTVGLLVAYPESENLEGCIPGLYPGVVDRRLVLTRPAYDLDSKNGQRLITTIVRIVTNSQSTSSCRIEPKRVLTNYIEQILGVYLINFQDTIVDTQIRFGIQAVDLHLRCLILESAIE